MTENQNPEQKARDNIDRMLKAAGWVVQNLNKINLHEGAGQAVREYPTDSGPADYVLFVSGQPVGVIEAKRQEMGEKITTVEEQTEDYAAAQLKWVHNNAPLPFLYQSTGVITRFTDQRDPKPRSREVFQFFRPETLSEWLTQPSSLRARLQNIPPLNPNNLPARELGLRNCQEIAIRQLEHSYKADKPRALIQMATGAGKTYTAITSIYRLLKHADAKRVLFLVDTKNLGEQAEQELMTYVPNDDNRKFTELYNVQRLKSSYVANDSQVCISTIQRMYAILKGEELDPALEELNPAEQLTRPKTPLPVTYNPEVPLEFFDFIVIDECHRSIYNLWQQVLDYFDATLIGLTATPDKRTFGFFNQNLVSEYTRVQAVADGVNVDKEVFVIETDISTRGGTLKARRLVQKRERLTRKKRWAQQDEDEMYTPNHLDRTVVNPSQIRTIIQAFRDALPAMFPGREEVPKTLVFAKTDSHADDIIQIVREEFGEGNAFCKKVTYKSEEDPKSVLAQFRNDYNPRIAVTVDMIATGTDVKPLECLLFMRDVKSSNYFEQMDGRGTRTIAPDDLKKVSKSARAKTHYVLVDAVGVMRSKKNASPPLITKPTVPLKDLAMGVMMGASDADTVGSLAGRLARLNTQLNREEQQRIEGLSGGVTLTTTVKNLFEAIDADRVEEKALSLANLPEGADPGEQKREAAQAALVRDAARVFTGELIDVIDDIRRSREQTLDHDNIDRLQKAEWAADTQANAEALVRAFSAYLEQHKDQITALAIFYDQPYRRRELTYDMIRAVMDKLKADKPQLAPYRVWQAYAQLDFPRHSRAGGNPQPLSELTALVALIRRACGIDASLSPYADTVRRNFQNWVLTHHAGGGEKFNDAQMAWLRDIRDHIMSSFHFERDDLERAPFDAKGGLGKMHQLFGSEMDALIDELNEALAA